MPEFLFFMFLICMVMSFHLSFSTRSALLCWRSDRYSISRFILRKFSSLSIEIFPSSTAPSTMPQTTDTSLPAVDTSLRFVRVIERRADGLVAFEFSIGWPELAVELMLPAPAFEAFCANNRVQRLDT